MNNLEFSWNLQNYLDWIVMNLKKNKIYLKKIYWGSRFLLLLV